MESDNINSFRFLKQNILTIRNISKSKNNYNKVSKIESNKEKCMSFRKIISNNSRSVSRHKDSILSEIEKVPKYCKKDIEKETKENLNLYNKTCHSNGHRNLRQTHARNLHPELRKRRQANTRGQQN